jgi:hypothetical protein
LLEEALSPAAGHFFGAQMLYVTSAEPLADCAPLLHAPENETRRGNLDDGPARYPRRALQTRTSRPLRARELPAIPLILINLFYRVRRLPSSDIQSMPSTEPGRADGRWQYTFGERTKNSANCASFGCLMLKFSSIALDAIACRIDSPVPKNGFYVYLGAQCLAQKSPNWRGLFTDREVLSLGHVWIQLDYIFVWTFTHASDLDFVFKRLVERLKRLMEEGQRNSAAHFCQHG